MATENIPVAANVLGTIGTVFWCIQLVPQIWHNWRHKKTDGLPASMMLLWAVCKFALSRLHRQSADIGVYAGSVPFGVYMILQVFFFDVFELNACFLIHVRMSIFRCRSSLRYLASLALLAGARYFTTISKSPL